jgi:hypothetical protein
VLGYLSPAQYETFHHNVDREATYSTQETRPFQPKKPIRQGGSSPKRCGFVHVPFWKQVLFGWRKDILRS